MGPSAQERNNRPCYPCLRHHTHYCAFKPLFAVFDHLAILFLVYDAMLLVIGTTQALFHYFHYFFPLLHSLSLVA